MHGDRDGPTHGSRVDEACAGKVRIHPLFVGSPSLTEHRPEQRKLEIMIGDFVKATLPYFDVCISNTPYQISSPLIFRLLSHRPIFRVAILMFQREFAMRLVARPGTELWSRLSANVQLYSKVDLVMHVGKNNFRPPPKVESSVIRLVPLDPPPPVEFGEFDGLGRIIFSRRNKTIHAGFMAKGVMEMLESNWKTWASTNDVVRMHVVQWVSVTYVVGQMIEDDFDIKKKVEEVLNETGFTDQRAAKMGVDDLLKCVCFTSHGRIVAELNFTGYYQLSTTRAFISRDLPM